jgi:hypothetical protein
MALTPLLPIEQALADFSPGLPFAVAFSGGADSTALLLACARRWPGQVMAVHIHHGLQDAADAFEAHCRALCQQLNVPLAVRKVQAGHAQGQSPEDAARKARYAALAEAVQSEWPEVHGIALAQHADDQARRVRQRVEGDRDGAWAGQQISALLECLSHLKEAVPKLDRDHIPDVQKALMELEVVKGQLNARAEVLAQSLQSTRSDFLRTLSEIIGPAPTDRNWKDEWTELTLDFFRIDQAKPDASEADILNNRFGKTDLQTLIEDKRRLIEQDLSDPELCWTEDESTIVQLLTRRRQPLARSLKLALHSRTKAVQFSASLHALCETLFTVADKQRKESKHVQACPSMFKHLYGEYSLEKQDSRCV